MRADFLSASPLIKAASSSSYRLKLAVRLTSCRARTRSHETEVHSGGPSPLPPPLNACCCRVSADLLLLLSKEAGRTRTPQKAQEVVFRGVIYHVAAVIINLEAQVERLRSKKE